MIKDLIKISDKIIVYSTCELWSQHNGSIDINTEFRFHEDDYILSKFKITDKIKSLNEAFIIKTFEKRTLSNSQLTDQFCLFV